RSTVRVILNPRLEHGNSDTPALSPFPCPEPLDFDAAALVQTAFIPCVCNCERNWVTAWFCAPSVACPTAARLKVNAMPTPTIAVKMTEINDSTNVLPD
ncbi:hypothetical protein, partial [Ralstonia pseudosolanacearum]|uniref:hypothetical protein n=1 Tax=Ralstonia pseudosolanacearum TaxID=1310165 RepID=UPI002011F91F